MKFEKLSKAQKKALNELVSNPKEFRSSYLLKVKLTTLRSLVAKDFIEYPVGKGVKLVVKSKQLRGAMFCPATNIVFKVFRKGN